MPRTLYLNRDPYGGVKEATFEKPSSERFDAWTGKELDVKIFQFHRKIKSYKDLVWAFCKVPCQYELFNAAWRRVLQSGYSVSQSWKLSELHEHLE